MALIQCPCCEKMISNLADSCVHCGHILSNTSSDQAIDSCRQENNTQAPFPKQSTKWLNFYIYAFLPFKLITPFMEPLAKLDEQRQSIHDIGVVFFMTDYISPFLPIWECLTLITLFGLYRRKLWGWQLNLFFIYLLAIISPLGIFKGSGYYVMVAMLLATFTIPCHLYFKKRKHLFK